MDKRGYLTHHGKLYKAGFASFTTFWFAQKITKIVATRHVSHLNCACGRRSAPDPTGGAYSAPPDPYIAVFKRFASQQRRKRDGKRREEWEGKEEW